MKEEARTRVETQGGWAARIWSGLPSAGRPGSRLGAAPFIGDGRTYWSDEGRRKKKGKEREKKKGEREKRKEEDGGFEIFGF